MSPHCWIIPLTLFLAPWTLPLARAASNVENPLFGYTHIQPSPFTLPAGRFMIGSSVAAYGVTDFMQVGTDILRDAFQIYNVNAKFSIVDHPLFAAGLGVSFESYNYQNIDDSNPDLTVRTWRPGAVTSFALLPELALFTGASFTFSEQTLQADGVTSGYVRGSTVGADLSWAYNPPTKKKGIGNVLSGGLTYDLTYSLIGFGFSHHWPGFQLGIHYYANADRHRVLPILVGGTVVDF